MTTLSTLVDVLGVYLRYCVLSCLRYFAIAGPIYCIFYVWFRRQWTPYRIQQAFPGRDEVGHEIRWSLATIVCTGVTTVLLYELIRQGRTQMYFEAARHGWAYFGFSVVLGIVGYDAWSYWQHRLLHTPWWFRHVHRTHHRITNPTPFANFALHPIETLLGAGYFLFFVALVPVHPMAVALVSMYVFGWGMIAHLGYELYPKGFTRHSAFQWLNTATFHNMHHKQITSNYGSIFTYWDRLMGTDNPAYHDTFDGIKARSTLVVDRS